MILTSDGFWAISIYSRLSRKVWSLLIQNVYLHSWCLTMYWVPNLSQVSFPSFVFWCSAVEMSILYSAHI